MDKQKEQKEKPATASDKKQNITQTVTNKTSSHEHTLTLPTKNQNKPATQPLQQNSTMEHREEYFRYYTAQGIKEEIWMLTVAILSSDQAPEAETGNERNSRIHFYEQSILFIEAVNQLYQQQQEKRRRKSTP